MNITLTDEQYSSLVSLARKGVLATPSNDLVQQDKVVRLEDWLRSIEKQNNIVRYLLWVQWQNVDAALPPNTRFPETWPPTLRQLIERISRPITRGDVDEVLKSNASGPVSVLVTEDPAGIVGWKDYNTYFGISP